MRRVFLGVCFWVVCCPVWGAAENYGEILPSSDVVALWHLNGNATDSAGSNDGTVTGATSVSGRYETAYNFDNNSEEITFDPSVEGLSEVTLTLWVYPESWTYGFLYTSENSSDYWQFSVGKRADTGSLTWMTRDTSTGLTGSRNNDLVLTSPTNDQWSWVVLVYSVTQNIKAYYLNGVLSESTSTSIDAITSSHDHAILGNAPDQYAFDGVIDEVVIYGRALSAAEIRAMYALQQGAYGVLE